MDRRETEERARAEALARDELARLDSLRAEVAELESQAGIVRRSAAALVGSRFAGLLAGYGASGRRSRGSKTERRGADLRRRRFRLARRKRLLEREPVIGHRALPASGLRTPHWLREVDHETTASRGPELRRRFLADLLAGGGRRSSPARVLVHCGCPATVGAAVAELGLETTASEEDADVAIVAGGDGSLGIDWILAGERRAAASQGLAERLDGGGGAPVLAEALRTSAGAMTFCIRIAGRDWEAADRGGDAALARSLARALGERGHQALLQVDAEAGSPLAECLDVLLVLRGRPAGEPTPGRLNLLWQISHPEETGAAELERYDRILVASNRYAEHLAATIRTPVQPLLQFTDPELFHPLPGTGPEHEVAFVGNWRGEFRRIVWDAIQAGHPPRLYGRGWDLLVPEHAVAEHVPHDELYRLYSSCEILLCDHWEDMRRHGFISNKVFDALACEAFAIADDNPALAEELPGAVETYSTAAELGEKIERYLADPRGRQRLAERGRELTLAGHTVERRAEQLIAIAAATARRCKRPALAHLQTPGARRGDASAAAGAAPATGSGSA